VSPVSAAGDVIAGILWSWGTAFRVTI